MKNAKKIFFVLILSVFLANNGFSQQGRYNQPNIVMHLPPIAEFSFLNLCFGDTTKFIDQSTGGAYKFFWTIYGAGSVIIDTSSSQNLSFYFPAVGTYTVNLDADNGHIVSIAKVVTVGNTTIADFTFQRCANNFNNISSCSTNFWWDFGDGSTSTDSLPVHQYADTGHYQANLIACKGLICDTVKKQIYVDAVANPDASFTLSQSFDTLFYQMNNFLPYETITWYFGDGTSAVLTSAQSYHVYQDTGNFAVSVQVINPCGMRFATGSVYMMFPLSGISSNSELNKSINIYPNPANEIIKVESSSPIIEKIILFDMLGNSVFTEKNKKPEKVNEINISNFSSGQYFIQVRTKEGVINKKIIVR